jgi:hypothetical protein
VALAASPARVALVAPASRTIDLRNAGATALVVDVARTKRWVNVRPGHLVVGARSSARLTLRVGAGVPGDHQLLVLFSARPRETGRVAVRIRLGLRLRIHVPGRVVRRLEVQRLQVRSRKRVRLLLLAVANRGNVAEQLRGLATVTLFRGGRLLSRLRPRVRGELFPGAHAVLAMPYSGGARGFVTAVVTIRPVGRVPTLVRRYRLRL